MIKVKLIKRINSNANEIVEKTKPFYEFPIGSTCCNQLLFINDFVPVLVEDEEGKKYKTLFCKECATKTNEWFEVMQESLVKE